MFASYPRLQLHSPNIYKNCMECISHNRGQLNERERKKVFEFEIRSHSIRIQNIKNVMQQISPALVPRANWSNTIKDLFDSVIFFMTFFAPLYLHSPCNDIVYHLMIGQCQYLVPSEPKFKIQTSHTSNARPNPITTFIRNSTCKRNFYRKIRWILIYDICMHMNYMSR